MIPPTKLDNFTVATLHPCGLRLQVHAIPMQHLQSPIAPALCTWVHLTLRETRPLLWKLVTRLDQCLRSEHPSSGQGDAFQDANTLEAIALEERVLYSAAPIVDAPDADAASVGGSDIDLAQWAEDEAAHLASQEQQEASTNPPNRDDAEQAIATSADPAYSSEIIFIDTSVEDYLALLEDINSLTDPNRQIEIVFINPTQDGIEQITESLSGRKDVDAIHIVSHGTAGAVSLGTTSLSHATLSSYEDEISAWNLSLSASADLLIYGCDLAATAEGRTLVDSLNTLCGCDVAASENLTGHSELGGDWILEYAVGDVSTDVALSFAAQASWYGTLDIATGLVGHYEFEENGGSTLTDSSGTQNGSLVNSGSWTTDEAVGTYAYDFGNDTGSVTYVTIPNNAAQDFGTGDFTVSLWYNDIANPESDGRLIGDYDGTGNGFVIYAQADGAIEVQLHDGATVSTSIQGIFDGTWNQLTVVRSGSNLEIYHNGVSVSSSSGAGGNINSGNALRMGAGGTLGGDHDGKLDDVRLYTRALSSTDVDELVALGPAVSAPPGAPVGYSNPTGGDNSVDYITNVTFAGINNTSGQDTLGYGNYTSEVATVTAGDSNNLSVTIVEENNNYVTAWIDWNQDGDFADPGEEYVVTTAASSPGPHTVNIATPVTATSGTTVMRIGHAWGQAPHADGGAQYLELEDYSVNVLGGGPQTFTVTNTNDSGAGSLRQAIIDANATSGTDRVVFDITGGGTQVIDLVSALPSITDSILIDGTTQDGWVEGSFLPIVIDANDGNFDGLRFQSGATGSLVRGLVIRDSAYDGIDIAGADSVTVVGNFVGAYDSSGMFVSGEEHGGASITFSGSNNIIGGNTDADRNVIGGADNGVVIVGAAGGQVSGNYIGLDATGQNTVDIFFDGVRLASGATNVTIGGDTTAHRNIIAGVGADGVQVQQEATDNNTIRHNWIGTLADGTSLANVGAHGIFLVTGADNTQIRDNVILGADGAGISIDGSSTSGTYIGGNYIGTNSDESAEGYVNLHGIELAYGANSTTIGAIGDGNIITNVQSEDNAGVRVFANAGTGNQIRGNSIYGNAGLGIDIASENADANDSGDIDTGGNNGQNWAVLKSASINDAGSFAYSMDTTTLAAGTYTIDFYASTDRDGGQVEGQRYLGSASGIANGNTNLTGSLAGITLAPGEYVTLVTTDASGNSSEFSNYAVATDSDAGGSTPADTLVSSTSDGGLSVNEDGGNDIYLKADSSPFSGESQVTVEVDFQISTPATGLTTLLSYATGTNQDELYVGIDSGGEVFFRTSSDSGSGYGSVTHAPQLLDGSRHTLSVTWDSTGGILMFYVDGVQLGTGRNDYQELTTIEAGGTLVIGQRQTSPGSGFDADDAFEGTIYGARIFNDIRTAQEIADSHGRDVPFDEAGLIANWRFDDLSNDGVTIDTVAGNNLTVNHTSENGFSASEASLTLRVDENALDGTIVGAVSGLDADREAVIASLLAADPDLAYDAETNSFYKALSGAVNPSTAQSNANSTLLNSVAGKLPTITSFHENELIRSMISSTGNNAVWLSASDAEVQDQWRWEDGTLFWNGGVSGSTVDGAYQNFKIAEPNGGNNASIVHLAMDGTGQWLDTSSALLDTATVVEWDADEVLDATQALDYSIQSQSVAGAFAVDSSTGEISVANGLLLDAETLASHSVTVRVTDVDGNSHDEAFTITLNDLVEANTAPTNLSSGIEINTDGGNDVYLQADDGNALLGGASAVTVEFAVQLENPNLQAPHLLSYRTAAEANEFRVYLSTSDGLMLTVGGNSVLGGDASVLRDGQVHQVSVSWDSSNGLASFYVDGELLGTNTVSTGHTIGSNGTLVIGQGQGIYPQWTHTQAAQGTFYDVRIWDDIRSEAEIALNAQHSFYRGNLPDGLIANWQMDGFDISGEVVDIVGDNNLSVEHATGTGFTASTPIDGLHVDSSGSTGSSAGFVRPTDPDSAQDIVTDGRFHSASDPGASTEYFANQSIGGWTVSHGRVDFVGSSIAPPDGSEYSVQLNGSGGSQNQGGIEQSLATVPGRQFQVIFEVTGDWSTDQDTQQLRVTADSASQDFSVDYDAEWSTSNPLWQQRSMTFTADDDLTLLNFSTLEGDVQDGPLVANIRVIEVPTAVRTILNNDSTLTYDAGTNKFYRFVNTNDDFSTQLDNATRANLNGISGGLVRIDSQYENDLIRQFVIDSGNDIWLGASDTNNDGNWNWLDGTSESGDQFWAGGAAGSAATGFYAPTFAQSEAPGEDAARITSDGTWADDTNGSSNAMVIEWDASEVISGFTFSLSDASNNFEINSSTGEVTVAATHTLDFASYSLHDVDVTVTDATGNSYVETMTIVVGDHPGLVNDAPVLARVSEIDFEDYTSGSVNNQHGWRAESYNIQVNPTGGVDGGTGLTFDLSGPRVGGSASLVSDTAVPDLTNADHITSEFSLRTSHWGGEFAFAYDADLDGRILRSSGEQALTVKLDDLTGQITVTTADGSTSNAPNGASAGDWLNFRWEIDFTANAGQGSGTLFFRNVTEGQTQWQTDSSLTDINLGLSTVATDKTNPANWNGVFLHMEGAGNGFDIYRIEVQSNLGQVPHVEDGAVTVLAPGISVFDAELSPSNFAGATLTLARTGVASVDDQFVATGTISTLAAGANNLVVGGTTIGSVTQNSGGTLVLTFNANATNELVNQAMQQIGYRNTSNTPPASVQIDWTFNDNNSGAQGSGGALSDSGTTTVNITSTNDVPTIANLGGDVLAYAEGSGAVVIDQSADSLITDVDSSDFDTGTLTVSFEAGSDNTEDVLAIANQGTGSGQVGISGSNVSYEGTVIGTFTGGTSGSDLVITFDADADAAAVSALVQAVTYENTDTDNPTAGNRTVRYVLTDGDGGVSANYDTTVAVAAVNDAPKLVGQNIVSNGSFNSALTNWTTTGNVDHAGGQARFGQIGGANGTLSQTLTTQIGNTYIISFEYGDASITQSQEINVAVTGALSLLNTNVASGTADDTLQRYQHSFVADSATTTVTFTDISSHHSGVRGYLDNVSVATDAPPNTPISYTENDGPVAVDSTLSISDVDDTNIESSVVRITNNYANGEDILAFVDTGNITASWDAASGTLTLTGSDTVANYEAALRSVTYQNTSESPNTSTRTISFTANDGDADSNVQTRDINVVSVNDAPTNAGATPADQTVVEDVATDLDLSDITIADLDDNGGAMTVTLATTSGGTLTASSGGGVTITGSGTASTALDGTLADINTFLDNVTNIQFTGASNAFGDNADAITVTINDNGNSGSGGGTDQLVATVNVDITAVNDAPTGLPTITGTVTEDQTLTADTSGIADNDGLGTFTYQWLRDGIAITGATSSSYTLGDADVGSNISVQVSYTDGNGTREMVTSAQTADVANINDLPTGAIQPSVTVTEDVLSNLSLLTANLSDADHPTGAGVMTVTLATSGGGQIDAAAVAGIAIAGNGASLISLTGTATDLNNYLNDSSNLRYVHAVKDTFGLAVDTIAITINDNEGSGDISLGSVVVDITGVNDAPIATSKTAEVQHGQNISVAAVDGLLVGATDAERDQLTVLLIAGPDSGTLVVGADGSWTYTPSAQYFSQVSFQFAVFDGTAQSATETMTIDIAQAGGPTTGGPHTKPGTETGGGGTGSTTEPGSGEVDTTGDSDNGPRSTGSAVGTGDTSRVRSTAIRSEAAWIPLQEIELQDFAANSNFTNELKITNSGLSLRHSERSSISQQLFHALELENLKFEQHLNVHQQAMLDFQQHINESNFSTRLQCGTAAGLVFGATAGIAAWSISGTYLASLAFSAAPAWMRIDPIFVMHQAANKEQDDISVADIITRQNQSTSEGASDSK